MEPLGRHLLIEMWGCNGRIDDAAAVEEAIREAVAAVGATLLNLHVHAFSPQGVTGVAALAESHLALHSWPERGYLAADVFTCGPAPQLPAALDVLRAYFEPQSVDVLDVARGRPDRRSLECGALAPLSFSLTRRSLQNISASEDVSEKESGDESPHSKEPSAALPTRPPFAQ